MNPNERASGRFFSALPQVCPLDSITHVHLTHQTATQHALLANILVAAGFTGTLVAARASIADAGRKIHPDIAVRLSDHPSAGEKAEHILLELGPGRAAMRLVIEAALEAISPTGRVWIFGSKETGIISLAKQLANSATALYKGHLRLISIGKDSRFKKQKKRKEPTPLDGDGFCRFQCHDATIVSRPGLFSWHEPDPASLMLLEAMARSGIDPGPKVLDWGCGNGLITAVLARRWPESRFILSDDQWSAVRSACLTMNENRLDDRTEVIAEDGIGPELSRQEFSTIVSNPPFHRGVQNDSSIVADFLAKGVELLRRDGSIWLVGNRFLDHAGQLARLVANVETVARDESYSVVRGWR